MKINGHLSAPKEMDNSVIENFPLSSLRLLGSLQMGLGVVCLLLGVVDLFLFLYVSRYNDGTLSALTVASLPVWFGLWFIVTGSVGCCLSLQQKTSLIYFKRIFMVLSILCCALFGPVLCGIEIYIVVLRTETATSAHEWLLPLVITFFGLNEIVCALITASICCCCSPFRQDKDEVMYTRQVDEQEEPLPPKYHIDKTDIFNVDTKRTENVPPVTKAIANTQKAPENHGNTQRPTRNNETKDAQEHQAIRPRPRIEAYEKMSDYQETAKPETEKMQPRVALSSDSLRLARSPEYDQYKRLKQMTLPGHPDDY